MTKQQTDSFMLYLKARRRAMDNILTIAKMGNKHQKSEIQRIESNLELLDEIIHDYTLYLDTVKGED